VRLLTDELSKIASYGLEITESTHLQGQLVAVHPAYDDLFDALLLQCAWETKSKARMLLYN
jgi:hypothetical protein